jgi:hypothetical protein
VSDAQLNCQGAFFGHAGMVLGGLTAFQYNLLPAYSSQITWGVSTFHTFGHEFPCQAVYHPQKREGFGFTDGEGCGRLWASLQKLIPGLRVSGV